jgi:phosphoglycerate kinase
LKPVALRLQELLNEPVKFVTDCVGEAVKKEVDSAKERVVLLENLRYHAEEEANDANFAKQLASLGEVFVNDAFGTAHRAHASTEGVTHYLKSAAGFLLEREIQYLGNAVQNPHRPFAVILGGAKVSDKIGVIDNLLPKCDMILIGGGMSYTFLKAKGEPIGNSKLEQDKLELAKSILEKAKSLKKEIILPIDHVVVEKIDPAAKSEIVDTIPDGKIAVDIGPKSIKLFKDSLAATKTIVWNGPLGIFEMDAFSRGTEQVANFIGTLKATTIIGGGDTAAAIAKFKLEDKMTHISTGGGASLEYLEGKELPGVKALTEK